MKKFIAFRMDGSTSKASLDMLSFTSITVPAYTIKDSILVDGKLTVVGAPDSMKDISSYDLLGFAVLEW